MHPPIDSNLATLDHAGLIERMMGNAEMADRMVKMFIQRATDDADELESVIRTGRREQIASAAHRHKGTAKTLSANRVACWAERIEAAAASDSIGELLSMVACLREEHQILRNEIEHPNVDAQGQKE